LVGGVNPLNEFFLFTKWLGIRAAAGAVDPDQLVNKNCERAREKKKTVRAGHARTAQANKNEGLSPSLQYV